MRRPGIHLFARGQNGGEQHAAAAKRMGSLSSYRVRPTPNASEQCPADRCTAVDKQRLAGDETSISRQQELDCRCDFVWRAEPVHGNAGQIPFFALAPRRIAGAEQFCFGRAGATALTVMPVRASSSAHVRVELTKAAIAAA